jgi:hypothetical protein
MRFEPNQTETAKEMEQAREVEKISLPKHFRKL